MSSSGLTRRSIAGDCRIKSDNDKKNTNPAMTTQGECGNDRERKPSNDRLVSYHSCATRRKLLYNFSSKKSFENFSASSGYAKFFSAAVSFAVLAKSL